MASHSALVLCTLLSGIGVAAAAGSPKGEWPMPGHDNRLSAQAELPARMRRAPAELWSYDLGRVAPDWAWVADVDGDGADEILYGTRPLICMDRQGNEKWRAAAGQPIALVDLDADGTLEIVTDTPLVISGSSGRHLWTRSGPGSVGGTRTHVGKFLPHVPGQ